MGEEDNKPQVTRVRVQHANESKDRFRQSGRSPSALDSVGPGTVTQRKTAAGDAAAQQAQTDRLDRRAAAAYHDAMFASGGNGAAQAEANMKTAPFRGSEDEGYSDQRSNQAEQRHALIVKRQGEGLKGYPDPDPDPESSDRTMSEPYLKVNTPNEYPQSSWGHIGRRAYGGSK